MAFDPTTELLYGSHSGGQWNTYKKVRAQPARRGTTFHHTGTGLLPRHTQKAKISPASSTTVCFEGAATGPLLSFGLTPSDPWRKELQQCWLLDHANFPTDLSSFCSVSLLHAVSDGSHQPFLSESIGSAAWIIETPDKTLQCNGASAVPGTCKDSYRSELTGILIILSALQFLCMEGNLSSCLVKIACDNDSAIAQCDNATESLPTNIPDSDILRAIYRLLSHLQTSYKITFKWTHVTGHADKHKTWEHMTRLEQLNTICDQAAKQCLHTTVMNKSTPPSTVPFEGWSCSVRSQKIQHTLRDPVRNHIARSDTKEYLIGKGLLTAHSFALVNWDAISQALSGTSSGFSTWASKHITGFCGTAHRQHLLKKWDTNLCPSCHLEEEKPAHVVRCTHPKTSAVYTNGVNQLVKWLRRVGTDPVLADTISLFLHNRGMQIFMLPNNHPDLRPCGLLTEQSFIGFDNFLMGMVATALYNHQHHYYRSVGSNRSAQGWAAELSLKLMRITHACWNKRCRLHHGNSPDYLTIDDFQQLHQSIRDEFGMGPEGLHTKDQFLFKNTLVTVLGWKVIDKQAWLLTVQLAREHASSL